MLKLDEDAMQDPETQYPGVREQVMRFENARLPVCSHCGSADTAEANIGIIGRTNGHCERDEQIHSASQWTQMR